MIAKLLDKIRIFLGLKEGTKTKSDVARTNLQRNFLKDDPAHDIPIDGEDRKTQSMLHSQGTSNFSGSAYNGPGNVNHEKIISNKGQRNF